LLEEEIKSKAKSLSGSRAKKKNKVTEIRLTIPWGSNSEEGGTTQRAAFLKVR
jgi:hypothetical protein